MMMNDPSRMSRLSFAVLALTISLCTGAMTTPASAADTRPPGASARDQIVITLAGDTGFGESMALVDPRLSRKGSRSLSFADAFAAIAPEFSGDVNFINVETVVTDQNGLPRDTKDQKSPYTFRSHPNAFRHLAARGINLMSLANNHGMDYGAAGLRETLKHITALEDAGLLAHAGLGLDRAEAAAAKFVPVGGATLGFSAIGIITNNLARHRAGASKPGQMSYRIEEDLNLVTSNLRDARADIRLLSIHYGTEYEVRADNHQRTVWRAIARDGIDIIAGHHAHVVRGVEMTPQGGLIFYGLGNLLHHGTRDITGYPVCKSYGLVARVHMSKGDHGRWTARAVEAVPITDTHVAPSRYPTAEAAHERIHALNGLSAMLDDPESGAKGLRFTPQADGSGLFCANGAAADGGRIGALCENWVEPPPVPPRTRRMLESACAR